MSEVCVRCSAIGVHMRLGNGSWKNRNKGEDVQLAYWCQCLDWPMCSQKRSAEFGGWDKTMTVGRDIR